MRRAPVSVMKAMAYRYVAGITSGKIECIANRAISQPILYAPTGTCERKRSHNGWSFLR